MPVTCFATRANAHARMPGPHATSSTVSCGPTPEKSVTSFSAVYAEALGIRPRTIFLTTLAVVILMTRPFFGRLGDRVGYRRVFFPCLILMAVGLALLTLADNRLMLMIAAVVFGTGFGTAYPVFAAHALHTVPSQRRGAAFGAIQQIRTVAPATRILVLTTYDSDGDILRAVEAGATGYLLKDTPREELFRAIRATARGDSVLSPSVASKLVSRSRGPVERSLSAREIEVLTLVARGVSNKIIAKDLRISEATVKTHLLHIFAKLGVDDRTAAVTAAMPGAREGGRVRAAAGARLRSTHTPTAPSPGRTWRGPDRFRLNRLRSLDSGNTGCRPSAQREPNPCAPKIVPSATTQSCTTTTSTSSPASGTTRLGTVTSRCTSPTYASTPAASPIHPATRAFQGHIQAGRAEIRDVLEADNHRVGNELVKVATEAARVGDFQFWKFIAERIDGKIPERLADANGGALTFIIKPVERDETGDG